MITIYFISQWSTNGAVNCENTITRLILYLAYSHKVPMLQCSKYKILTTKYDYENSKKETVIHFTLFEEVLFFKNDGTHTKK